MEEDPQRVRLRIFAFVAFSLFGALVARLWYLQALESEQFQQEALTNVLEPVYEEAPRGRILDRNGRVIVDNKVVQVVTIDRAALSEMDAAAQEVMFLRLAIAVSRSGRLTKVDAIREEVADRSYGPFERIPVAVDVDPELLVFVGERPDEFPGVEVVQRTVRHYPYGSLAAHLLGYVGPITRAEWDVANALIDTDADEAKTYQLNHEIGKTGVERVFEDDLRGVPGVRFLEVDASGNVVDERKDFGSAPVAGNDVWLTIDIDLQDLAETELDRGLARARLQELDEGEPPFVASAGSVVAVDPRDGALLAMASYPTYEPADFVNGISSRQFEELIAEDNFSPILNRAIQGTYAPGSTFKLVTAYAALEEGVLGPDGIRQPHESYQDTGSYTYSGCFEESSTCVFSSPYTGSGRSVNLSQAITVSSDTYFYEIGGEGFFTRTKEPGDDGLRPDEGIQKWARLMGLGLDSGVQLPYERGGVVPDRDYYDFQFEEGVFIKDGSQWFGGDTINLSIGQGELLVTPLQLANTYATFANGGLLHQPNMALRVTTPEGDVVREIGPRVLRDLEIPDEHHRLIEDGLLGVPRSDSFRGTAWRAFADVDFPLGSWPVAGKTGTAEVKNKADTSLFVAYGPTDYPTYGIDVAGEPEISISVVLEQAGFGSSSAAPVAAAILEKVATDSLPRVQSIDEITRELAAELAAADPISDAEVASG